MVRRHPSPSLPLLLLLLALAQCQAPRADDAARLPAVLAWARAGGAWLNPALELRDGRYGTGVHAAAALRRGEALVRVPRSLAISGGSVLALCGGEGSGGDGGPLAAAAARLIAQNQTSEAVSLFLAHQRSGRRRRTPSASTAAALLEPFIASMPSAVANALAFSAPELDALRGSAAEAEARAMQRTAARQHAHLRDTEPALFGGNRAADGVATILAEDMLWATSMVMSRGFGVSVPPPPPSQCDTEPASGRCHVAGGGSAVLRHMIPLMDAFNHDSATESSARYDADSGEFILTTHDDWEEGDEVFIHYGGFTPSEFLNGYGFVPREGAGDVSGGGFLNACWKAGLARPEKSESGHYEVQALEALSQELRSRERQYSTTLEQDEAAILLDLPAEAGWEHMGSLLDLLVGEKRALRDCGERVVEALVRAQLRKIGIT